jgi:hypothetical protein
MTEQTKRAPSFFTSLVVRFILQQQQIQARSQLSAYQAGGIAGTSVDVALFPIDTIKTRLQAPEGFLKAGGFRGVYNGIGAAAAGSAPGGTLTFSPYCNQRLVTSCWSAQKPRFSSPPTRNSRVCWGRNLKSNLQLRTWVLHVEEKR